MLGFCFQVLLEVNHNTIRVGIGGKTGGEMANSVTKSRQLVKKGFFQ